MKVCDRHIDRRAIDSIVIVHDDGHFDVCEECKSDLIGFLSSPDVVTNGRGKRKRDLAKAN